MQTSPSRAKTSCRMQVTLPQMQFTDYGIAYAKNSVLWLTHQLISQRMWLTPNPEE
ncbi:hypothetical protein J53TS2_32180 [Paenibacillus sp. J53TS2]|jgi:hypothetical protein|nr:hypothetical protein J53TS2_32180 [Paenibacillus sp. J53TS2]